MRRADLVAADIDVLNIGGVFASAVAADRATSISCHATIRVGRSRLTQARRSGTCRFPRRD
jgi:hypothetical protein